MANPGPRRLATKARNRHAWFAAKAVPGESARDRVARVVGWLTAELADAPPDELDVVLADLEARATELNSRRQNLPEVLALLERAGRATLRPIDLREEEVAR